MEKVVLLADDQMIVRKGLKALFDKHFTIKSVDEVATCHEIMARLKSKQYSHLIMDIFLSDGPTSSIIPTIIELYTDLRVMIFSDVSENLLKNPLAAFGVHHFISKNILEEKAVKGFQKFLNNEFSVRSLNKIDKTSPLLDLTPREFEVYSFMLEEKTTSEIAKKLNVKKSTVSTIKHRIFKKNNAENWDELKILSNFKNLTQKKDKKK